MPQIIERHRDQFTISTDPARLDNEAIAQMLKRSYWASGRPRERLDRALANSLVFGIYAGNKQIGIARVVSDYAVFAYLCDVFIDDDYRAHGLGKWLMQVIHDHPDLQGLRRWTLVTRDAHGFYRQFGWKPLDNPAGWMEILVPNPGEGRD